MTITTHQSLSKAAAALGGVLLLLGAGACGGDDPKGDANATGGAGDRAERRDRQQGGPDGQVPGASGKVAAVDGSTAQVQGIEGQVAVTWNGSTTFTKQVNAALSDVEVGDCVLVGSEAEASSDSTGPATEVTASSVRITPKTDGSCGLRMRGPGGSDDAGGGPQFSGPPPDAPEGAAPQIRGFGGAVGEVTAVSATGFTVDSVMPGSDEDTAVAVTVDDETTYTTMAKGAASDVEVGVCVRADGTTDDTGAVTATSIAVTPPEDGQCGGFARIRSSDDSGSFQES